MKKLYVIGSSGAAQETTIFAEHIGFSPIMVDPDKESMWHHIPIIKEKDIPFDVEYIAIGIARLPLRRTIAEKSCATWPYATYPSIIDPSAYFYNRHIIEVGRGSIIAPRCIIMADAVVGAFCYMNILAVLGHDSILGDYSIMAPNCLVMGHVAIGSNCYIGSGAVLREGIKLVDGVTVGAQAMVTRDLLEPGVYVGVPAERIK